MSKWTCFMDMHSGGSLKENWQYIYIEASEKEAKIIFYNRFGHNPHRVTCTCCGEDYSITESDDLGQATGYERGCDYAYFDKKGKRILERKQRFTSKYIEQPCIKYSFKKYKTLEEYKKRKDILFVYAKDIKSKERIGEIPEQGYVWV